MKLIIALSSILTLAGAPTAADQFLPAGLPIACTMQERNFSLKTAEVGDPTICYLPSVMNFGKPLFPRGSYLTGRLAAGAPPGRLWGKGDLTIEFDRLVLPDAVRIPISAKVIALPKYRITPDGKILGRGHAKRDVAEWMFPPLWPADVINLPRRGPYPALKGEEERLLLRVIQGAMIPDINQGISYYTPTAEVYHNPVHTGGDGVLVRKDGCAVSVVDYWHSVPGQQVDFLVNTGPGQQFGSINLRDLNIKKTVRINRERGIQFRMPIDCEDPNLPFIAASGFH
jgi:hypothetical protein